MTKADKIRYILKYQNDIDLDVIPDYQTYTKKELEEMRAREVTTIFLDLMEAEDIVAEDYRVNTIMHGRSEQY